MTPYSPTMSASTVCLCIIHCAMADQLHSLPAALTSVVLTQNIQWVRGRERVPSVNRINTGTVSKATPLELQTESRWSVHGLSRPLGPHLVTKNLTCSWLAQIDVLIPLTRLRSGNDETGPWFSRKVDSVLDLHVVSNKVLLKDTSVLTRPCQQSERTWCKLLTGLRRAT